MITEISNQYLQIRNANKKLLLLLHATSSILACFLREITLLVCKSGIGITPSYFYIHLPFSVALKSNKQIVSLTTMSQFQFRCSIYLYLSGRSDNIIIEVPSGSQMFYKQSSCFNLPPPFLPLQASIFLLFYNLLALLKCQLDTSVNNLLLLGNILVQQSVMPQVYQSYVRFFLYHCGELPSPPHELISLYIYSAVKQNSSCNIKGNSI